MLLRLHHLLKTAGPWFSHWDTIDNDVNTKRISNMAITKGNAHDVIIGGCVENLHALKSRHRPDSHGLERTQSLRSEDRSPTVHILYLLKQWHKDSVRDWDRHRIRWMYVRREWQTVHISGDAKGEPRTNQRKRLFDQTRTSLNCSILRAR